MDTSKPSQRKGKRLSPKSKADVLGRQVHWISLSAKEEAKPFGSKRGGETILNARGKALAACWRELPTLRPSLQTDALMIGPRRMQGLIILSKKPADAVTLGDAIKLFKVLSSLRLAQLGITKESLRNLSVTEGQNENAVIGADGAPAANNSLSPKIRGPAPSGLWKKGYLEKPITGSAELADARKALKGLQAR